MLCADEVNLKSNLYYDIAGVEYINQSKSYLPAYNALAIMARGIFKPLAYAFMNISCYSENF